MWQSASVVRRGSVLGAAVLPSRCAVVEVVLPLPLRAVASDLIDLHEIKIEFELGHPSAR